MPDKKIHNYHFGQMPEMPWRKDEIKTEEHCKTILLNTTERSGSTWLLDSLRSLPAVSMDEDGKVCEDLGLKTRRYPSDLSGKGKCRIIVRKGTREHIPSFSVNTDMRGMQKYFIDKIHPHFYKYKTDEFFDKLYSGIIPIYLVRHPLGLVKSFLSYQERNPNWNVSIVQDRLVDHLKQSYQSILDLSKRKPGLVLDYSDLESDYRSTMGKVYYYLWKDKPEAGLFDRVRQEVAKENRPDIFVSTGKTDNGIVEKAELYVEDIGVEVYYEILKQAK